MVTVKFDRNSLFGNIDIDGVDIDATAEGYRAKLEDRLGREIADEIQVIADTTFGVWVDNDDLNETDITDLCMSIEDQIFADGNFWVKI